MKTAKELYADSVEYEKTHGYFPTITDYFPIIQNIGNVLVQVDDHDYQGDSRIIFEKDNKFGFLIFGWGSCSGCDSLQACESIQDVQDLMDSLNEQVSWFDSLDELKSYFAKKDWSLDYCFHSAETKQFISEVLAYSN